MKKNILCTILLVAFALLAHGQCVTGSISGSSSLAIGSSVTLTNVGASSGAWRTSDASIASIDSLSGIVTGVTPGSVTVTYALSGACTGRFATSSLTIVSGITGHNRVCVGDTTSLQHTVAGGTWSSSASTVASVNSAAGLVQGISTGSAVISYTFSIAGTTYTDHVVINVSALPSLGTLLIGGLSGTGGSACIGNLLTAQTSGEPVIWSTRDASLITFVSSDSTLYLATLSSAGTFTLQYTSAYCNLVSDSTSISVHSGPSAPGTITGLPASGGFCNGDTATLHIPATGGIWSIPGSTYPTTIDSTTGLVTVVGGPVYDAYTAYYTITDAFGCTNLSYIDLATYPTAIPGLDTIIGPMTIAPGTSLTYSYTETLPFGYFSYWFIASGTSATIDMSTGLVTAVAPGVFNLVHEIQTGCGSVYSDTNVTVAAPYIATSTSMSCYVVNDCTGPNFGVNVVAHASAYYIVTNYGDGTQDSIRVAPASTALITSFSHTYAVSGTYTIGQKLYNGGSPIDSVSYSYAHRVCRDVFLTFFQDSNGNCALDTPAEHMNSAPLSIAIDSNGVAVDTVSATGGLYYPIFGSAGDVYSFRTFRASSPGFSCVSGGIIYDTIGSSYSTGHQLVALTCPSASGFDVYGRLTQVVGTHAAIGTILVSNSSCVPQNATVVMNFDSRFLLDSARTSPLPSSISGDTLTWNLIGLSATAAPAIIRYGLSIPSGSATLTPRDTIQTTVHIAPLTGDSDTTNNNILRIDTVRSSYDPNHITVTPEGNILNGTRLKFAVEFENDGNDTARNIYVLDTLSDNLDPTTFNVIGASATMDITMLHAGGHNIVKFDFPNILLADSTHHGHCTGTVLYDIATRRGLADGTRIGSNSGIYFDDNSVVLTGTVINTIVIPAVTIATAHADTVCPHETVHFTANAHTVPSSHYQWLRNGATVGTDSLGLTIAVSGGDTVKCIMQAIMDDTAIATSNSMVFIGRTPASAGSLSGASSVCAGAATTLTSTISGGAWTATNSSATVSGGIVTGVSGGMDTIIYTVTNACGSAATSIAIAVNTAPAAAGLTGSDTVCVGSTITVTPSVTGGAWTVASGSVASVATGVVTGVSAGTDTVLYALTNACGTTVSSRAFLVMSAPTPGTISGPATLCIGDTVTLTRTRSGGSWTTSGATIATVSLSGGFVTATGAGFVHVYYTLTNACGSATATDSITVHNVPTVSAISGVSSVCAGDTIRLTTTDTGGVWSSSGTSIATVAAGLVRGFAAGSARISYTLTNTCGSTSVIDTITVMPLPSAGAISGASSVCAGATTTLTETVPGGTWSSAAGSIATISGGGVVTGVSSGSVFMSYSVTNTCGTSTANYFLLVLPLPSAGTITGIDSLCPNSTTALADVITGGTWVSTNSAIASVSATGVVTGMTPGTATIFYVVSNACGNDTATKTFSVRTLAACADGLPPINTSVASVEIYPNPNDGNFVIGLPAGAGAADVTLIDVNGKIQVHFSVETSGVMKVPVDANRLSPGIYFLKVEMNHEAYGSKVIIK